MKRNILILGLGGVVCFLIWLMFQPAQAPNTPGSPPTPNIIIGRGNSTPRPDVIHQSATQAVAAGQSTIPPPLYVNLYNEAALKGAAEAMKTAHSINEFSVVAANVEGVGSATQIEWLGPKWDMSTVTILDQQRPFTMTYQAIVPAVIKVGGRNDFFWDSAAYTVTNVQTETATLPTGQLVYSRSATLSASYLVVLCVTSVEHGAGTAIMTTEPQFPSDWAWIYWGGDNETILNIANDSGVPFRPNLLALTSINQAREDSTKVENLNWAYQKAAAEFSASGNWHSWFQNQVLVNLGSQLGFNGVDLTLIVDDRQIIRCDGSEVK